MGRFEAHFTNFVVEIIFVTHFIVTAAATSLLPSRPVSPRLAPSLPHLVSINRILWTLLILFYSVSALSCVYRSLAVLAVLFVYLFICLLVCLSSLSGCLAVWLSVCLSSIT